MTNIEDLERDEDMRMVIEDVAGSLRGMREDYPRSSAGEKTSEETHMEDYEDEPEDSEGLEGLRLMAIDTNILIGHLSLLEWLAELLIVGRRLGVGSGYRCGLLIPKMVRAEIDKHKMPHNKNQSVTVVLEPYPSIPQKKIKDSIHSPESSRRVLQAVSETRRMSLYEAADRAIRWMARLYEKTPDRCRVLKFQTKNEMADPSLGVVQSGRGVSPDTHIIDCAVYFRRLLDPVAGGLVLLTNDKALSLEAELEGIKTLRVQAGLTVQGLLRHFDPVLAERIDQLAFRIELRQLTMFDLYRFSNLLPANGAKTDGPISRSHTKHEGGGLKDPNDQIEFSSREVDQISEMETETELEGLMMMEGIQFPIVLGSELVIHATQPQPTLHHLHQLICHTLAILLRQRLFEHLLHTFGESTLEKLIRALRRFKETSHYPITTIDPNHWSCRDCLMIIEETWNESCYKLFQGEDQEDLSLSENIGKNDSQGVIESKWSNSSNRLIQSSQASMRVRKIIQVLKVQMTIEEIDVNSLKSKLFWDGLIEDCEKLIKFGKFYKSIWTDDSIKLNDEPKKIFKLLIDDWKKQTSKFFLHCLGTR